MSGRVAPCALYLDTCLYRTPCARRGMEDGSHVHTAFDCRHWVCFALTAVPAHAADDIEAKAQLCAACHGQNGVPADPKTVPIIWGQQQSYLVKQLRNYRNGERDNPIMTPIAKSLAQEDIRKMAAYFAAKSWPPQRAAAASSVPPNGIAQCQPCHQPNFEGGPPAPRLAGLSYEYLASSMRNFAD